MSLNPIYLSTMRNQWGPKRSVEGERERVMQREMVISCQELRGLEREQQSETIDSHYWN